MPAKSSGAASRARESFMDVSPMEKIEKSFVAAEMIHRGFREFGGNCFFGAGIDVRTESENGASSIIRICRPSGAWLFFGSWIQDLRPGLVCFAPPALGFCGGESGGRVRIWAIRFRARKRNPGFPSAMLRARRTSKEWPI